MTLEYLLFASSSSSLLLLPYWIANSRLLFASSNQLFSPHTFELFQQVLFDMLSALASVATNKETNSIISLKDVKA